MKQKTKNTATIQCKCLFFEKMNTFYKIQQDWPRKEKSEKT